MPFDFTFDLKVDLSPLTGLKKSLVNRIMRPAIRKGCKTVLKAARANTRALAKRGFMSKSLLVKIKRYPTTMVGVIKADYQKTMSLGVARRGKYKGQERIYRPAKILHIVERGGKHSQGKYPMKNALTATLTQFQSDLAAAITTGVQKYLAKKAK